MRRKKKLKISIQHIRTKSRQREREKEKTNKVENNKAHYTITTKNVNVLTHFLPIETNAKNALLLLERPKNSKIT